VLHEFAPRVGIVLPGTRDPRALAQLSAMSEFSYDAQGVRLNTLQALLDDTHVQGSVAMVGEPRAARGAGLDAVMRTLNGHFDAKLAGGALEGIDLQYQLGRAQALITREAAPPSSDPPRTRFDAFSLSAQITNGVARTTDLTISSAALRVTGHGSANLANKALDLTMQASILNSQGASFADIPFKMDGTYVDPKISADVEALAKGQLKQKLQDVLERNGLKGLFSK
jgi:uncharacterized protein involved in outer membrane biogenesis